MCQLGGIQGGKEGGEVTSEFEKSRENTTTETTSSRLGDTAGLATSPPGLPRTGNCCREARQHFRLLEYGRGVEYASAMSPHPKCLEPAKCPWCGLVASVPHRSDTDCISALRDAVKLHKSAVEVSSGAVNLERFPKGERG